MRKRSLEKELVIVIAVKIVAIVLLWWIFVRDQRIEVQPADIAADRSAPEHINRENTTHGQ